MCVVDHLWPLIYTYLFQIRKRTPTNLLFTDYPYIMTSTKNDQFFDPPSPPPTFTIRKNEQ